MKLYSLVQRHSLAIIAISILSILSLQAAFAEESDPISSITPMMQVHIMSFQNYTPQEQLKAQEAAALLEQVLNSIEFRQAVLDHTWKGKKQFANNNDQTNEQILQTILEGQEILLTEANHSVDLDLTIYNPSYWGRNVVGYTYPDTLRIWQNRRFFSQFTTAEIAGNLIHEWCHKIGYDHDYRSTRQRPYSVPYAIGDMVSEFATNLSL